MKLSHFVISALSLTSAATAAVIPENSESLSVRSSYEVAAQPEGNTLEKRKGGGGGGRGGSSSSSGSSSGGRSGSDSSGSSSSSSGGRTSSSSNTGGRTSSGSGVTPSYGGGKYYSGGASVPYTAGSRSPLGVTPYLVGGAALGVGAAAIYAHGAYIYPYAHPYSFHNNSMSANSTNTTLPVDCVCARYSTCSCEDQTDDTYLSQVVGNGSASDMNSTVARVADVNGTNTLLINGTVPNGTTASGGSDSAASSLREGLFQSSGWLMIAAGVGYTVLFI